MSVKDKKTLFKIIRDYFIGYETKVYTVGWKDDYISIARKFNMTWQELLKINNIEFPYYIKTGQRLLVRKGK